MSPDLKYLLFSTILTFVQVLVAAALAKAVRAGLVKILNHGDHVMKMGDVTSDSQSRQGVPGSAITHIGRDGSDDLDALRVIRIDDRPPAYAVVSTRSSTAASPAAERRAARRRLGRS